MAEVKLFGFWASPYSRRVEMALKLKGVEYEYVEEDLSNKSTQLLQYNPVHKRVPVLLHNGKPIVESLVILEYIDETWGNGPSILPKHPHARAVARFWAKFLDETVFGARLSPFSLRVEMGLKLKGVEYEFIEEDLSNKSHLLLQYNPVHKKIPVLLHNGKPVAESLVILEYIDETWEHGPSILPKHPHDRATARFWARFVDEKCMPAFWKACWTTGEEQVKGKEEAEEVLKFLDHQLEGKKFFGGESIGLVDIAANFIAYWLVIVTELVGIELITSEKFPHLCAWIDKYVNSNFVKEHLPDREILAEHIRTQFLKTSAAK